MTTDRPANQMALRLSEPGLHLSTFLQVPDPNIVEILARTSLNSLILDCQHGMFDGSTIGMGIAAAAMVGKPVLIRIPVGAFAFASRAIDLGAAGIISPMINNASDAKRFVDHVKYPPIGSRSWGPRRALPFSGLPAAQYLLQANEMNFAFAMIETSEALANLDDILRVPGIDGVFVGPMDLSVSLSDGAVLDPSIGEVLEAIDLVGRKAAAHGKPAGIFALDGSQASRFAQRGFRFVALAQDAMFLVSAAERACTEARKQAGL